MLKCWLTALAAIVCPALAHAQGLDWSGPYVGLQLSHTSGDWDETLDSATSSGKLFYDVEGNMAGAFVGYNLHNGGLLLGAELGYQKGEVDSTGWTSPDPWSTVYDVRIRNIWDLRARVGMPHDRFLPYLFLGASRLEMGYGLGGKWGGKTYTADGLNYGIGVEMLVGNNGFVGIEYIARDLSSDLDGLDGWSAETKLSSVQLRGGIKF